ncbi:MAG: lytic transglycosylase domain-containing protein [Clostridia bacterium]|nr:lytic transglycosylase domain-containing protein [Clostridia bacterium]
MKRQKRGEAPLYLTALILCVALLAALGALGYLAVDRMEGLRTEEQGSQVTLAYEEEVLAASQKHGVSAARIYAVILTESSFRPAVISEAGAVGLMQMLPSTYKEQCAKRGVPYDPEDLKDPGVNIDFCTEYLRELYDLTGSWDTAHLAYHAGIGKVRQWLKDPACSVDGITVENVPKESSRIYLERIRNAYALYDRVLEQQTPQNSVTQ